MNDSTDTGRALTSALRALAQDEERLSVSPLIDVRLMTEFSAVAMARRRRRYLTALAVAAALLVAAAIPAWRLTARPPITARTVASASRSSVTEVTTAFLPLTYNDVPLTDGHLVRLAVPRAALATFGLTPPDSIDDRASGTVLADVLVGDDGLARAVRFVRASAQKE